MKTSNTITLKKPQLIFIIVSIIVTTLIAIERRAVAWAMLRWQGVGKVLPNKQISCSLAAGKNAKICNCSHSCPACRLYRDFTIRMVIMRFGVS